jgi:hypothetical protein
MIYEKDNFLHIKKVKIKIYVINNKKGEHFNVPLFYCK